MTDVTDRHPAFGNECGEIDAGIARQPEDLLCGIGAARDVDNVRGRSRFAEPHRDLIEIDEAAARVQVHAALCEFRQLGDAARDRDAINGVRL